MADMTKTASSQHLAGPLVSTESITRWVNAYVRAWQTNARKDIANLFSADAEYHETPFDTAWVGREAIVQGWRSRWDWQQGGWDFDWSIAGLQGVTATITGIGHYKELGDFDNVWTVTFDEAGLCSRFDMLNTERT
jgi:hypothetical protein